MGLDPQSRFLIDHRLPFPSASELSAEVRALKNASRPAGRAGAIAKAEAYRGASAKAEAVRLGYSVRRRCPGVPHYHKALKHCEYYFCSTAIIDRGLQSLICAGFATLATQTMSTQLITIRAISAKPIFILVITISAITI